MPPRRLVVMTGWMALLAILWIPRSLQAQTVLQVLPQAQVTASGVFLDQLVAGGETNADWHVRLCDAPAPGRSLVLAAQNLRALVQTHLPGIAQVQWSGVPTVQVTRRMRMLQASELLPLLASEMRREQEMDSSELEVRFGRTWTPVPIADEPFSVRISQWPGSGLTPMMQVKFELMAGEETLGVWQLPLEVRLWRQVWVCRQPLRRGQFTGDGSFTLERRDVMKLHRDLLPSDVDPSIGMQAAENVGPGQPVLRRMLQPRIVVARGQVVDALLQEGALSIGTKAEAMEDGTPGQIIRVKNTGSRKEIRAKVLNDQTVQIQL